MAEREEWKGVDSYEMFTLFCLDNGKIALRTDHNTYVTAQKEYVAAQGKHQGEQWDWIIRAETSDRKGYEEFTLVEPDTWEQLPCTEVQPLPCLDMFERLQAGEVRIALRTYHSRYVTAQREDWDWILRAERGTGEGVHSYEVFTVTLQQ